MNLKRSYYEEIPMNGSYRILKLKSGEEIITRIMKREQGKVSMEIPMSFRVILMADPYTGNQREVTVLRDWITYTSDKFIKIPEDIVISYSAPRKEAIDLYEKEKIRKDENEKNPKQIKNLDSVKKDMENEFNKFLDNMLDNAKKYNPTDEQTLADIFNSIGGIGDEFEIEWEIEIPAEEISDETTETEINHPDYGNRWTDWSSDPREY